MQAVSSQAVLTSGVATHPFDVVISSSTPVPARAASRAPALAEYASGWLDSLSGVVRPSTREAYAGRLQRHVLPKLGERRLDEVGVDEILILIGDLRGQGYTDSTIATTFIPLSRLFSHAVRQGVIEISPISKLSRSERPRVGRRKTCPEPRGGRASPQGGSAWG